MGFETKTAEDLPTLDFPVSGLRCGACAARLTEALRGDQAVASAEVNFATSTGRLWVQDLEGWSRGRIRRLVEAAGYGLPAAPSPGVDEAQAERTRERSAELGMLGRSAIGAALTLLCLFLSQGGGSLFPHGRPLNAPMTAGIVAAVIVFELGAPFWKGAFVALRHGKATMDTLVCLGSGTALLWSFGVLLSGGSAEEVWFDSAAMLVTFLLLGRGMEQRAKGRARESIRQLLDFRVPMAKRLRGDGSVEEVAAFNLEVGDQVLVTAGELIPVDGAVVEGRSDVDESSLRGEAVPVAKAPGEAVLGGTHSLNGRLVVEARAVGADTVLEQVIRLVREAQLDAAPVQRMADQLASVFVPAVIGLALLVGGGWLLGAGEWSVAVRRFVTVVLIACPCALSLATPTAVLVGTGRAARRGILFRGGAALERAATLSDLVFDKTGTLTPGFPEFASIEVLSGSEETFLRRVAAAESGSSHPLAKALVAHAQVTAEGPLPSPEDLEERPGLGVVARVEGVSLWVGNEALLRSQGEDGSRDLDQVLGRCEAAQDRGESVILVSIDGQASGYVSFADAAREEAAEVVQSLADLGITVHVLSGDQRAAAERLAAAVGIYSVVAPLLPGEKQERIVQLQSDGARVAMVGDGINDAPALACADLGIAVVSGTDLARETSDVTLVSGDLRAVPEVVRVARQTVRRIRQNLRWALGYNVVLIPLAAGAGLPLGLDIAPMWAAAAMAASSVSVVLNSLR